MLGHRRITLILGTYMHSICTPEWRKILLELSVLSVERMLGHRRVTLILCTYMHSICTPGWRKILLELSVMPRSEPGLLNQESSAQTKAQPCTTLGQY